MLKRIIVNIILLCLLLCGCAETPRGYIYDAKINSLAEGDKKARTYTRPELTHTLMGLEAMYDDRLEKGGSIITSIDTDIQDKLGAALDDVCQSNSIINYACGIVMDTQSGMILAIASLPAFDADNKQSLQDKTIHITYCPGKTFMPFVYAAAIENGIEVTEDFDVQAACDAFVAIGGDKIYPFLDNFGFGKKTALALPGQAIGQLPNPDIEKGIRYLPMGLIHTVTPLQFISSFCALINKGTLYEPQLVTDYVDANDRVIASFDKAVANENFVSAQTCGDVIDLLNPASSDTVVVSDIVENLPRAKGYYKAVAVGCKSDTACLIMIDETVDPNAQPLSVEPILRALLEDIA